MAKAGFVITAPSRSWSGTSNDLMERLTAMRTTPASASQSEWQTVCRQIAEVLVNSDPVEIFTNQKTEYVDKLIVALGGTV